MPRFPDPCLCGAEDCRFCHPENFRCVCGRWIPVDTSADDVQRMYDAEDEAADYHMDRMRDI